MVTLSLLASEVGVGQTLQDPELGNGTVREVSIWNNGFVGIRVMFESGGALRIFAQGTIVAVLTEFEP